MFDMQKFFGRKDKYTVQAFGKLPLYSDYISVLINETANTWRTWLLNNFGRRGMSIPGGRWPIAFCPSPRSPLVVGLIEESSDGLREFPFSIFVVFPWDEQESWFRWDTLVKIWDRLDTLRSEVDKIETIDECYHLLRNRVLELDLENEKKRLNEVNQKDRDEGYLCLDYSAQWPILLGAPGIKAYYMHLLADNECTHEVLVQNWDRLSRETSRESN